MKLINEPIVRVIAWTQFEKPIDLDEFCVWETDAHNGMESLIEAAGRNCYQSWHNPAGRTNAEYIHNLIKQGHYSVLEHAVVSFYIRGISRACMAEFTRHRHLSFSVRSTRYVDESDCAFIVPDCIAQRPELLSVYTAALAAAQDAYGKLYNALYEAFSDVDDVLLRRKMARQAARMVLPNATETSMVVTGNLRAWRHFIRLRASRYADVEIRKVAILILKELKRLAPAVFADFTINLLPDGTEEATTPYGD